MNDTWTSRFTDAFSGELCNLGIAGQNTRNQRTADSPSTWVYYLIGTLVYDQELLIFKNNINRYVGLREHETIVWTGS